MPLPLPTPPAASRAALPPALPVGLPAGLLTRLPGGLADRFELSPAGAADAPALFALVRDCDTAVLGYPDVSLEDVEFDVADYPNGEPRPQALVRDRYGRVVSWWRTDARPVSPRFFADVYVDPALPDSDADRLAEAGWAAVLAWAHGYFEGPADPDTARPDRDQEHRRLDPARRAEALVATGILDGDIAGERRLRAAGFTRVRTFWRMHAPAGAVPAAASASASASATTTGLLPAGVTLEPATDPRLVHRLREETFAEHWGHEPETYDDWLHRVTTQPGYDPSLWLLARVDSEPVGFQICSRQMADEDALYVATLGTLAPYRGRGIASALLGEAFRLARQEGFGSVRLSVDSDSPTGAPSVYRRAGFDVLFAMHAWHRPLGLS